ncbi:hypothetical protein [Halosimplex marinum]|uniref:hypothetical protein n=1 Tax=Halosimplex marinum TaxID=3396620 RepID=UPI003F542931
MASIPVPFTDLSMDTSDPQGFVMTFVMLVLGFGAFVLARDLGGSVATIVSQTLGVGSGAQNQQQNSPNIL